MEERGTGETEGPPEGGTRRMGTREGARGRGGMEEKGDLTKI